MHHVSPSRSPHNALHSPSNNNWGSLRSPHTCGVNGKLSIYIYICIYICIYVCLVRAYSVYIHPAPFVRDAIFPHCMLIHVDHCCSRDKTSRIERLNSENQRNRDLKTVRKGRLD